MSYYFNLIVNLVEDRFMELAVNGGRRIQSFQHSLELRAHGLSTMAQI